VNNKMFNYLWGGGLFAAGMEPTSVGADGGVRWQGFGAEVAQHPDMKMPLIAGQVAGWDKLSVGQRMWKAAPNFLGLGFSSYIIASAWAEGGIGAAYDMAVVDLAASAGVARWGYGSPGTRGYTNAKGIGVRTGIKQAGTTLSSGGMASNLFRYAGGATGATIGQVVGGALGVPFGSTAGAVIGGYIGSAPLSALARHPGLVFGAMAATAAVGAVYTGFHASKQILDAGYSHRQMQKGVNTDGDMAAFMTQNATTMRAKAVQAIHKSYTNGRSALGQEANFMHYPGRNYHSRYR
jgi:hypothetical protein